MKLKGYTEEEKARFVQLRAIEWSAWPAFLSMGIGALLLPFFGILKSIIIVMVINLIWTAVCMHFVSAKLANYGVFIKKLMWITCPAVAIYFFINHQIGIGVVALFWGFISMFLQVAKIPGATKLGQIEQIMYRQIS